MFINKVLILVCLLGGAVSAVADEGMWLFNQFPKETVQKKYGVAIDQSMLDHLRLSSVRVGASGSFVSPNGLIFTNHHVVLGCVQNVSSPEHDYVSNGFYAKTIEDERKCPGGEANVLLNIEDVTAKVKAAVTAAGDSPQANQQRKAEMVRLENECSARTGGHNCQAVTLYGGAQYHLYEYKKYTDVRLVFAPEYQIGFFGGDPDNFTYPRYCLDIGFFRVYENGKPAETPNYLRWSRDGARNGEAVFVSGNPASTERLLTMAEFEYYRDVTYPYSLKRLGGTISALKTYMAKSAENERAAKDTLFGLENSYKSLAGRYSGLQDKRLTADKQEQERKLRAAVDADPKRKAQYGQIWQQVADAVQSGRKTFVRRALIEGGPAGSRLFIIARSVLRMPEELAKPEDQRLSEYAGSMLHSVENRMYAATPITPSLDAAILAEYFRLMQSELGGDPIVQSVLGGKTPEAAADAWVAGTKLADVGERKRLAGSVAAVRESEDSMIRLVRLLDPESRKLRKQYEDNIEAVLNSAKPKLAEARFAVNGPGEPPDATFTLRLSYGQVKGYEDNAGKEIPFATNFRGLYRRATGKLPYVLPPSWIAAKDAVNPSTPFDFVSTADIVGGNSGSPTVNAKGEIVGIIFDGNIESLPSHFEFTETQARAVHVASQAILEALDKVYHAGRVLDEVSVAGTESK